MNFPVWDLGFAHGLLIAVVAITHVFVSHFAIGGGFFLVLTEMLARKQGDSELLDYVKQHSRFFILLTLVFGAISGVGIWFTIGLINPAGTSALIHAFVWAWAIEWVFFFVEVAAAMVYYYGWDRLSAKTHVTVGWIYFVSAWMSMVVINGILSFQMTPGAWIETQGFWDGLINPTYYSSLAVRTVFSLGLAGLFAVLTGSVIKNRAFKSRLLRYAGGWTILPLVLTVFAGFWWWGTVPEEIQGLAVGEMPIATLIYGWIPMITGVFALLVLIGPILMPRIVTLPYALLILIGGLAVMGSGEWIREGVRKPFVIYDYMYSNGILATETDAIAEEGYLANAKWVAIEDGMSQEDVGEQIFRVACMNCHARTGYNGLQTPVIGWDQEFAAAIVSRTEYVRGPMPPWLGTDEEAEAVASYLLSLNPPGTTLPQVEGEMALGRQVFDNRCGSCHTLGGFRDILELVDGLEADEITEMLEDLESDYMPPLTGSAEQGVALGKYLHNEMTVDAPDGETAREGGVR